MVAVNPVVFVSGPMRGRELKNLPAFQNAEDDLFGYGIEGLIPHNLALDNPGFREAVRRDLNAVVESDGIYMLEGWQHSEGAKIEHSLAIMLGKPILYEGDLP
jgi:hypothetical protein